MLNENIFNKLYSNIDGSSLSWKARDKISKEENDHIIYGEFPYSTIKEIFTYDKVKDYIDKKINFCDLGSGTGRICIEIGLELPNIKRIYGIELLKELIEKSNEIKNNFSKIEKNISNKINFINDNFFNINLSEFDLFFMHYPMKNAEDLYLKLEEKMKKELKSNSIIISMIRNIKDTETFPEICHKTFQADYGNSTAYYHIKK